jgi:crotonobetainyl-CoA:carnitine CoA-transferase CaiB-like acyl-CoA transferase
MPEETGREQEVIAAVGDIISSHSAEHWQKMLAGTDTACAVVANLWEAHARVEGTTGHRTTDALNLHILSTAPLPHRWSRCKRYRSRLTASPVKRACG